MEFGNRPRPDVAHGRAQAAGELMHHVADRPLVGHLPLDAFGNKLQRILDVLLEVAVGGAARHCADRTHAAIGLVGAALPQEHLAGCLVGARQQRADHGDVGACGERLGEVTGKLDAAVGDHGHVGLLRRLDRFHDGGELGHADTGHDARGADRARTDAHLDRVRAGVDQRLRAFGGSDVTGDHLHGVRQPLDAVDRFKHARRMAVCGIHHDQIDAGIDQPFGTFEAALADGRRGGHAEPTLRILAGQRMRYRLFHILDGDETDATILVVDHEQLLDAMLVQHPLGFILADALAHRDEVFVRHQFRHLLARIGREPHVAVGEDSDQLAGRRGAAAGHHRNAGEAVIVHQGQRVGEHRVRADGKRIDHHAGLVLLHLPHLRGLPVDVEVAVDDAETASLRHGDRHARFGDGIHGGGHDRNVERNGAGDAGADVGFGGQDVGQAGLQQHVVERVGFVDVLKSACKRHRQLHSAAWSPRDTFRMETTYRRHLGVAVESGFHRLGWRWSIAWRPRESKRLAAMHRLFRGLRSARVARRRPMLADRLDHLPVPAILSLHMDRDQRMRRRDQEKDMKNQPENRAKHDQDHVQDGRKWLSVEQQPERRHQGSKHVDHGPVSGKTDQGFRQACAHRNSPPHLSMLQPQPAAPPARSCRPCPR